MTGSSRTRGQYRARFAAVYALLGAVAAGAVAVPALTIGTSQGRAARTCGGPQRGSSALVSVDVATGAVRQLCAARACAARPSPRTDAGSRSSRRAADSSDGCRSANLARHSTQQLALSVPVGDFPLSWQPSTQNLVFLGGDLLGYGADQRPFLVDVANTHLHQLGGNAPWYWDGAQISPDGAGLAFLLEWKYPDGHEPEQLAVYDRATGRMARLAGSSQVSEITSLTWSPDGRQIAFSRGGRQPARCALRRRRRHAPRPAAAHRRRRRPRSCVVTGREEDRVRPGPAAGRRCGCSTCAPCCSAESPPADRAHRPGYRTDGRSCSSATADRRPSLDTGFLLLGRPRGAPRIAANEREGTVKKLFRGGGGLGLLLAIVVVAVAVVAATSGTASGKTHAAKAGPLVAFLLPENVTPRWESSDAPMFKQTLQKLFPGVTVDVLNALNNPSTQLSQAEAELAKGAKVLVVAAVDQKAFAVAVKKANTPGRAGDRIRPADQGLAARLLRLVRQRRCRQGGGEVDGDAHGQGRSPGDHQRVADGRQRTPGQPGHPRGAQPALQVGREGQGR